MSNQEIYDSILSTDILNRLNLFVATISTNLSPFNFPIEIITKAFKDDFLDKDSNSIVSSELFEIIAINTNYEHFCRDGCEFDIKIKEKKKIIPKKRQPQGDESIFHSAIQITILLNMPLFEYVELTDANKEKVKKYFVKLYSTGKLQIPGIIEQDLNDGIRIINGIINYINELKLSDNIYRYIEPDEIDIIMMNYNSSLCITSTRILFNFNLLGEYIFQLEKKFLFEDMDKLWDDETVPLDNILNEYKNTIFNRYNKLILPPFLITNTKLINNGKYISFLFVRIDEDMIPKNVATVKIFQKGKINILGTKNKIFAEQIYEYIKEIIYHNIYQFIAIKLLPDRERTDL